MSNKYNKIFVGKGYQAQMYKWSPGSQNLTKVNKNNHKNNGGKPFYCNATAGSQGQDWITTYVYDLTVVNSIQQHDAYVECDYVQ